MNPATEKHRSRMAEASRLHRAACDSVEATKKEWIDAEDSLSCSEEAQGILQAVSQAVQEAVHDRVAGVVSRCLEAVFDEPYEFRMSFDRKRGRTEATLSFVREGKEVDPMTASGGGVVDVAAFALRTACLMLSRPPVRRLVVLDEPFKYLSVDYRPRVRAMVEGLAKEMGMQFLLVTHMPDLRIGKVVEL